MIEKIKEFRRKSLRILKLRPIHKVIRLLKKHDFLCMDSTLEVFGRDGDYHSLDYIDYVKNFEIWEIDPEFESKLKNNFPKATVKITDSYREIRTTTNTYDTILIDNHQGLFADKCEHFEILKDCLQRLNDKGVIITNVMPDISINPYDNPEATQVKHAEKRKEFYNSKNGITMTDTEFKEFYSSFARKHGFNPVNVFLVKRNYLMTYLVLCLNRTT